jgi:hypothetical protein
MKLFCFELYNYGTEVPLSWLFNDAVSMSRLHGDGDMMNNEYGTVGGKRIGKGNRSTLGKSASVLLCEPIRGLNPGSRCRKLAINRLSYGPEI